MNWCGKFRVEIILGLNQRSLSILYHVVIMVIYLWLVCLCKVLLTIDMLKWLAIVHIKSFIGLHLLGKVLGAHLHQLLSLGWTFSHALQIVLQYSVIPLTNELLCCLIFQCLRTHGRIEGLYIRVLGLAPTKIILQLTTSEVLTDNLPAIHLFGAIFEAIILIVVVIFDLQFHDLLPA